METKKSPAVCLSRQKIDEAQSQQQAFLLVGIDIVLVVTTYNLCQYGELIYGPYI